MQRTMPAFVSMVALVVAASACGSGGGNAAGSYSNSSGNDHSVGQRVGSLCSTR